MLQPTEPPGQGRIIFKYPFTKDTFNLRRLKTVEWLSCSQIADEQRPTGTLGESPSPVVPPFRLPWVQWQSKTGFEAWYSYAPFCLFCSRQNGTQGIWKASAGSRLAGCGCSRWGDPVTEAPRMGGPFHLIPSAVLRVLLLHGSSTWRQILKGASRLPMGFPQGPRLASEHHQMGQGSGSAYFSTGSRMTSCRAVECCGGRGGRWELQIDI